MIDTINCLKNSDRKVFQNVYIEFHDKLYYFVFQKTYSEYFATEVAQITFIKLWERRSLLRSDIPLSSQIFQMAKTTMIDVLRKIERERLKADHIYANNNLRQGSGYEWIEEKDAQTILQRAMNKMPPMRKKVFSLRIESQYSYKEISDALCISIKTVNKHLELAMRQVRPFFETFLILLFIIS